MDSTHTSSLSLSLEGIGNESTGCVEGTSRKDMLLT